MQLRSELYYGSEYAFIYYRQVIDPRFDNYQTFPKRLIFGSFFDNGSESTYFTVINQLLKGLLKTFAPAQYTAITTARANQRFVEKYGVPPVAPLYLEKYGLRVIDGPFKDMLYIDEAAGSALLPKLIGSYERELEEVINHILATEYKTVIDVGCAEGYYAVGLGLRLLGAPTIHAFDTSRDAQKLCSKLASVNKVTDRIIIEGTCDSERLQKTIDGKSLVFCDCEGYEIELLQPSVAPALKSADILVELHDLFKPGITPTILERFQDSHDIQLIDAVERNPEDYPAINFLSLRQQQIALSEDREGPMQWAFMTPKST